MLLKQRAVCAGTLGFGMDMHALDALQGKGKQDRDDAAAMLHAGYELGKRVPDPLRLVKLWQPDVREGILAFSRFKVRAPACASAAAAGRGRVKAALDASIWM